MMIKEISISKSQTIQLRQYEPFRAEVSMTVELDSDDDPKEVYQKLSDLVDKKLFSELDKAMP